MAEERLDVVVDPEPGKRGINALIAAYNNMAGAAARAQAATTQLFNRLQSGFAALQAHMFSFRSILITLTAIVGAFYGLSNQFSRFQAFISAMSISVGTVKNAREEFSFLMALADRLGVAITSLSHNYSQLAAAATASGMSMGSLRTIFEAFATASRVLHLTSSDTRLVFYALTQMVSKGVVSMEELRRQLGEKLPGAMNIAAASVNAGMKEFEGAVRKGIVDSAKFLPIFAEEVQKRFVVGLPLAMRALDAEMNRIVNNWQKFIVIMFDLGVADAFTDIIRELNRIMGDKAVAEEFAKAIKSIAGGVTEFLKGISGESVRRFVEQFAGGVSAIGTAITDHLLPFLKQMLSLMKEIVAAWLIIKGAEFGSALGGIAGKKGAAIGGLLGGGAGAALAFWGNQRIQEAINGPTRQSVTGRMPQFPERSQGGAMDMGAGGVEMVSAAFRTPKNKHTLDDVLLSGGKDKDATAQLKKYEAALLSLQKKEADGGEFTKVQLDILAGKYDKLTEAQLTNLRTRAAIADEDANRDALKKEMDKAIEISTAEKDRLMLQARERYDQLSMQNESEIMLSQMQRDRELQIYDEAHRLRLINDEQWNAAHYAAVYNHEERITAIIKKSGTDRQKWELMTTKQRTNTILGELIAITDGVAQHNKLMFKINKVAAIAQAGISAHEGATRTLGAYPWPLAGILAALHYAAGAARIAAIAGTQFEGGGRGNAPSITASTPAPPVSPIEPAVQQRQQSVETKVVILTSTKLQRQVAEELAEGLNELHKDGFPMLFTVQTNN